MRSSQDLQARQESFYLREDDSASKKNLMEFGIQYTLRCLNSPNSYHSYFSLLLFWNKCSLVYVGDLVRLWIPHVMQFTNLQDQTCVWFSTMSAFWQEVRDPCRSVIETPWIFFHHALSCEFKIMGYHFLSVNPPAQLERASLPYRITTIPKVTIYPSLPGAIPFMSVILEWSMTFTFTFKSVPAWTVNYVDPSCTYSLSQQPFIPPVDTQSNHNENFFMEWHGLSVSIL